MEYRRISFWLISTATLLLLHHAAAQNKTDIPKNVNLSPIWGWRSATECLILYNKTSGCNVHANWTLTPKGVIYVNQSLAEEYCKPNGCANHTLNVLDCIHSVKRDYRFVNKAKVNVLRDIIHNGCLSNSTKVISTVNYTASGGIKMHASSPSSWVLSVLMSMLILLSI